MDNLTAAGILISGPIIRPAGCCCCCCHDEPVRQLPIWGDKDVPNRWGIPPDSESGGIRLSPLIVDSHLLTGPPLKGGCRCPQLTYCPVDHCQTIDVDGCRQTVKLQSVLWLCSGFYRSKDPTNSIKVLKETITKTDVQYITNSYAFERYSASASPGNALMLCVLALDLELD